MYWNTNTNLIIRILRGVAWQADAWRYILIHASSNCKYLSVMTPCSLSCFSNISFSLQEKQDKPGMIVCLCLHVHMHHTCDLFMLSGGCCNTEAEGYIWLYIVALRWLLSLLVLCCINKPELSWILAFCIITVKVILTHSSVLPWLHDSKLPQKSTMLLKIYKWKINNTCMHYAFV